MTCPNCNAEVPEGAKFCIECGKAIPQEKKCPNCGATLPINAKFCVECGSRLDIEASSTAGGISMGSKNVIAGDVIGKKEQYTVSGDATIIKNEDETKKVLVCHICGEHTKNDEGHTCPKCGEFVCEKHFNLVKNCCTKCEEDENQKNIQQYKDALAKVYKDGKVELSERQYLDSLKATLGLDENVAKNLESSFNMQYNPATDKLTRVEEINANKAKNLLLYKFEYDKALQLLEELYKNHGDNEEILTLYLRALTLDNPDKAKNIIKSLSIDLREAYLCHVNILMREGDFSEPESVLRQGKSKFKNDALVLSKEVEFLCKAYKKLGYKSFLADAKKLVQALPQGEDDYEKSAVDFVKALVERLNGNETAYIEASDRYAVSTGMISYFFEKNHMELGEIKCSQCGKYAPPHKDFNNLCEDCGNEENRKREEERKRLEAEERRRREEQERQERERQEKERQEREKIEAEERKRREEQEQKERERKELEKQEREIQENYWREKNEKKENGRNILRRFGAVLIGALIGGVCVVGVISTFLHFKRTIPVIKGCVPVKGNFLVTFWRFFKEYSHFESNFWKTLWPFSWTLGVNLAILQLGLTILYPLIVCLSNLYFPIGAIAKRIAKGIGFACINLAVSTIGIIIVSFITLWNFLAWVVFIIVIAVFLILVWFTVEDYR